MKVDFSQIDQDRFLVLPDTVTGRVLVKPKKQMFHWGPHELDFRSLLCRPTGEVVSAGFPKFFNLGEDPTTDQRFFHALSIQFTPKLDGTLVIRSVIDGEVHWRTRGLHNLGVYEDPVLQCARDQASYLFEPEYQPRDSLLMEYVGPDNHHVVAYPQSELRILARVSFSGDCLQVYPPPQQVISVPPMHALFSWHDDAIQEFLAQNPKTEGLVASIQTPQGLKLLKIKTEWYRSMASLKVALTPAKCRLLCVKHNLQTLMDVQQHFETDGLDWESFDSAKELFLYAIDQIADVEREAKHLRWYMPVQSAFGSRKELAAWLKLYCTNKPDWLFGYGIQWGTGAVEQASLILAAARAGVSVASWRKNC